MNCQGQRCAWCGAPATHYCSGCGKCICGSASCRAKSVASMLGFKPTPATTPVAAAPRLK